MGCRCLKMFYGGVLPEEKELSPKNPSQNNKPKTKLFNRVKVTSKIFKKKQDGVKIINDYIICETIGEGLFGKVKKVKKIEGGQQKIYAMKILSKALMSKKKYYYKDQNGVLQTKDGYEYFRRQFAVFKKIRHNNLIRLYEVIMNQQNQKIYLIIELAEKGQLLKWDDDQNSWKFTDPRRNNVTEDQLRNICRGCIKGLYHLHQNNIIHRDLKPQNILFNNQNQVKISDFGISLLTSHVRVNQLKGTDFFLSPQCFQAQRTKELDGRAIDVWGLGVTLYCFYFQKLPFYEAEFQDLINSIKSKKVEYGMKSISKQLIQLLEHMLEKDPNKRITIQGMIDNPWVNINHTSLYQQLKTEIIEVNSSDLKSSINIVTKKSSHNQQLLKKNMHQQLDKQKVPSINQTIIRRPQRPLSKITEEDQNAAQTQRALFYQTPQKNQLQIPLTTIGRLTQSRQIGPQG